MQILDFDEFVPEPKIITLKGKKFDVSEIPFEIALQVNEVIPIMTALSKSEKVTKEDFTKLRELIYEIFKISDPDLSEEWLKKAVTLPIYNKLITFIFESIFDEGKKKEEVPTEI